MGTMENIFRLMSTKLGKMASKAFESSTPEFSEAGFSKIRGTKPEIAGTIAVPS